MTPRQDKTAKDFSRREFLKRGATGAAILAGGPVLLAACGDDDAPIAATTPATATPAEPYKVGYGYIGPKEDNGWSKTHDIGRLAVEARVPNVVTSFTENIPFSAEATPIFENIAAQNDMIVINSEWADLLYPVVERWPDKPFLECDGHKFDLANLRQYYVSHHGPAYVMGVAAGLLTESNRLGYVGAFPTPSVYNDTNAFLLGARTTNPDVELSVVMIFNFFDPPAATQATNALIDGGADVVFDIQDDTTPLAVCQERGVWSCIWNKDNREFGPDAFVNAIALDWDDYYVQQVESAIAGTFGNKPSGPDLLGVGEGVDTTPWGKNVPQEVADVAEAARSGLLDGSVNVYEGPLNDNEGNQRLAAGETIDDRAAYDVNWSIEGITGVV
jgi:simple sugar transport system substrate-binding protein